MKGSLPLAAGTGNTETRVNQAQGERSEFTWIILTMSTDSGARPSTSAHGRTMTEMSRDALLVAIIRMELAFPAGGAPIHRIRSP